jgi:hypothetical protein
MSSMKWWVALGFGVTLSAAPAPTFYKDVLPILQERCQECHREGEIGPMPLLSYKQARPWAKAMRESVRTKKMPPWFADSAHGKFSNDRSMSTREIETLAAWADAGAPEGNAKDAPAPKEWPVGWAIPKPDLVVSMPSAFDVPATGKVDYQYIVLPTGLTEDKWVQIAEARPSARSSHCPIGSAPRGRVYQGAGIPVAAGRSSTGHSVCAASYNTRWQAAVRHGRRR